jgi:hypothetical protein
LAEDISRRQESHLKLKFKYAVLILLSGAFAPAAHATPIYNLTAGTLTYINKMSVCTPDASCPGGSNPFDVDFGSLAGTLTVTYAQLNEGSQYTLTNASFTTPSAPDVVSM